MLLDRNQVGTREIAMGIGLEITMGISLEITMEDQPGDYYGHPIQGFSKVVYSLPFAVLRASNTRFWGAEKCVFDVPSDARGSNTGFWGVESCVFAVLRDTKDIQYIVFGTGCIRRPS